MAENPYPVYLRNDANLHWGLGQTAVREELVPLLRGALELIHRHAGELERLADNADLALVDRIEEAVKE